MFLKLSIEFLKRGESSLTDRMVLTKGNERKKYVRKMFNSIAHRYDLLNHLLSAGVDVLWRKKAISILKNINRHSLVLDLATGTGDFAFETHQVKKAKVIGVDLAKNMLALANKKKKKKEKGNALTFLNGDGEALPFSDKRFDAVTISFGIRNMGSIEAALSEIWRVLKINGQVIILEFSTPKFKPFRYIYSFYFKTILPKIGKMISKDKAAYTYLPASVDKFPSISEFVKLMENSGFVKISTDSLLNGVAVIYSGNK
jgi:demethylmenaquinone methyltransferase/2-methoxy-6-polyprenyl-1,4-benzoquinol methylase